MARGKHTNEYNEINDIKNDLQSLKSNVVALTQHLTASGADHLVEFEGKAAKTAAKLKAEGARRYKELEDQVREKPGQAMVIAFAGGLLASLLLSRRG